MCLDEVISTWAEVSTAAAAGRGVPGMGTRRLNTVSSQPCGVRSGGSTVLGAPNRIHKQRG